MHHQKIHFFIQITQTKNGFYLRTFKKPVAYSMVREILLLVLKKIGLDTKQFSLQSLRSGGATAVIILGLEDKTFSRTR